MRGSIVAEKLVSIGLAVLILAVLPGLVALKVAFVLGHAHILAAWLYTYLAGKMTRAFLAKFVAVNLLLFGSYWLWPWHSTLILITPMFFLAHFLIDEVYLLQVPLNLRQSPMHAGRFLEILVFFVLYGGQLLDALTPRILWSVPGPTSFSQASLPLAAGLGLTYLLLWGLGYHRPDGGSAYFWGSSAFFLALWPLGLHFHYGGLLAFLILVHVLDWYFHFYLQLAPHSLARRHYLMRVLPLIGFSALIFALGEWRYWEFARDLYQETFYDLWSLVHLLFSLRLTDVRGIFRRSAETGA